MRVSFIGRESRFGSGSLVAFVKFLENVTNFLGSSAAPQRWRIIIDSHNHRYITYLVFDSISKKNGQQLKVGSTLMQVGNKRRIKKVRNLGKK